MTLNLKLTFISARLFHETKQARGTPLSRHIFHTLRTLDEIRLRIGNRPPRKSYEWLPFICGLLIVATTARMDGDGLVVGRDDQPAKTLTFRRSQVVAAGTMR